MKTVHFCTTDSGGAFKAASRINEAMKRCGADSALYVRTKFHASTECEEIIDTPSKKMVSKSKNVLNLMLSKGEVITDAFGTDITKLRCVKEADVILLHWVNSFVSYDTVKKLAKMNKPVLWVMHDMWLYTGGCHSDFGCGRFQKGCGNCPQIKSTKKRDVSYQNFRKKRMMLKDSEIVLVSPSRWNLECAKRSAVCAGLDGYVINNPIDTDVFNPGCDGGRLRKKLKISDDTKIILFGAMGDSVHKWEGISLVKQALQKLPDEIKDRTELVVFGNGPGFDISSFPVKTRTLGFIRKEETLAKVYASADVFVSPSVADNYPNTLLEAVCCGTPCVCFDIGGMRDIVETGRSGYLAAPKDIDDMSKGLEYVLTGDLKEKLSIPEENFFLKNNSLYNIGKQYLDLCGKLVTLSGS